MPIPQSLWNDLYQKKREDIYELLDSNGNIFHTVFPYKTKNGIWNMLKIVEKKLRYTGENMLGKDEFFVRKIKDKKIIMHFKLEGNKYKYQDDYEDYNVKSIKSKLDKINIK